MKASSSKEEADMLEALKNISTEDLKNIIINNKMVIRELIQYWSERLERYEYTPYVANGMDERVSMGVQNGRVVALKLCIHDLKNIISQ